ncbi:MAG: isoprenyl transferase [Deltaproteobacteria bacterium]|nr:isoprenyl transferase [Deltaproteobacteria bacterium]MBW2306284.1 isoprenyl transferase [Deltaproteobacteria bacterium]
MSEFESQALEKLNPHKLPWHVAIIMDGNGRWAMQRSLDRVEGHKAGAESVRVVVKACRELGIKILTLYAFSYENWQRPANEVRSLMNLLVHYLYREFRAIRDNGINVRTIGRSFDLPVRVQKALNRIITGTAHNKAMIMNVALSYGGRDEIVRTTRHLLKEAMEGRIKPEQIDEKLFARYLDTGDLEDPDLLIRTGAEFRISNFLLWQSAYTELYFTDVLWPDFRKEQLLSAILDYQRRERRFGMTSEQLSKIATIS